MTGKMLGRELWEWERRSGLNCLKDLLNVVVHSQAIEMSKYSIALISTNYALNCGLWLYQASLNCEIHKLVKKLIILYVWLSGALVMRQTAFPYCFLPQKQ